MAGDQRLFPLLARPAGEAPALSPCHTQPELHAAPSCARSHSCRVRFCLPRLGSEHLREDRHVHVRGCSTRVTAVCRPRTAVEAPPMAEPRPGGPEEGGPGPPSWGLTAPRQTHRHPTRWG